MAKHPRLNRNASATGTGASLCRLPPIGRVPFADQREAGPIWNRDRWPARWITAADLPAQMPIVLGFRLRWRADDTLNNSLLHVSADQRYDLWLDGHHVGEGPERGDFNRWYFETYRLRVAPGEHVLTARVWFAGDQAPWALLGRSPAFLLAAEGPALTRLSTGHADWQARVIPGYRYDTSGEVPGFEAYVGRRTTLTVDDAPDPLAPTSEAWWAPAVHADAAESGCPADLLSMRTLTPAPLPPLDRRPLTGIRIRYATTEASAAEPTRPVDPEVHQPTLADDAAALLGANRPLVVPPHTSLRIVMDFDRYACVWPRLSTAGGRGSRLGLRFAETLYPDPDPVYAPAKPHRGRVEGMYFRGLGDRFELQTDRSCELDLLWWRAGRYAELCIHTDDQPLKITQLGFEAHQYPTLRASRFASSDRGLDETMPMCMHTLEVSSRDVFFDSPYYEQLSYLGDCRISALLHYTNTRDSRLPMKVIDLFGVSALPDGFIQTRYPCRTRQVIPTFCPFWLGMLHDLAMWVGELDWVRERMHTARAIMGAYGRHRDANGLIGVLPGWPFVDWAPGFAEGIPPGARRDAACSVNWLYVLGLVYLERLERTLGEEGLAERAARQAAEHATAVIRCFWDDEAQAFRETIHGGPYTEQSLTLALLTDCVPCDLRQKMLDTLANRTGDLTPASLYFTHYVIEALYAGGRGEAITQRLEPWRQFAGRGLRTTPETVEPTRSDCHVWSAHPLYHASASIAGIRPSAPGFKRVTIRPLLGAMREVHAVVPHPRGDISVHIHRRRDQLTCRIALPDQLHGQLIMGSSRICLEPGQQQHEVSAPEHNLSAGSP